MGGPIDRERRSEPHPNLPTRRAHRKRVSNRLTPCGLQHLAWQRGLIELATLRDSSSAEPELVPSALPEAFGRLVRPLSVVRVGFSQISEHACSSWPSVSHSSSSICVLLGQIA